MTPVTVVLLSGLAVSALVFLWLWAWGSGFKEAVLASARIASLANVEKRSAEDVEVEIRALIK